MKTHFPIRYTWLFIFSMALVIGSCKDDSGTEPVGNGQLRIEFENVVGDNALTLNEQTYTNAAGEEFTVSMFKYYVSNITLQKADGGEFVQPESYYFIDQANPNSHIITIPDVPAGTYTGVTFTIGVDSTRNVSGAQTGALDPLNGMFWSWNSGYVYVKVEGRSPQAEKGAFVYHIGGFQSPNNTIRTVSPAMEGNQFTVRSGEAPELHYRVDLAKIFDAPNLIRFSEQSAIHGGPDAVKFADNYTDMFVFDHLHE